MKTLLKVKHKGEESVFLVDGIDNNILKELELLDTQKDIDSTIFAIDKAMDMVKQNRTRKNI